MSVGINTTPISSILFGSKPDQKSVITKIVDWEGRKICAISCFHEIMKVIYDSGLLARDTLKFGFANFEIFIVALESVIAGRPNKQLPSALASCSEKGKTLLLTLLRLMIRTVQSTTNFFGHLAGFLVHPTVGQWVEKQTNHLDRFKFLNVPADLDKLFKKNDSADYSADSFTGALPKSKSTKPGKPTQVPPPPIVFEDDKEYYVPDFSNPLDYYRILGLPQDKRTPTFIKKRYLQLSKKIHPDKNPSPNANEQFGMLTEAREALLAGKKPPRTPNYVPEPAAPQPPSEIEIPSLDLPEVIFMLKTEKALALILSGRESSKFPLNVIQQKCELLIEVIKNRQLETENVTQAALEALSLLEKAADAYLKLSKDFGLSGSFQILGKLDESSSRTLINKLHMIGKEILPFIMSTSSEESTHMKVIKSILGVRYFDKMNALYLLLVRSEYEKNKGYESYLKIKEYRDEIGPQFHLFSKMREDTFKSLIPTYAHSKSPQPFTSVRSNARDNYRYMVNRGDETYFYLFPKTNDFSK